MEAGPEVTAALPEESGITEEDEAQWDDYEDYWYYDD